MKAVRDAELVLISPSEEMKEDVMQYREEHFAFGDTQVHGTGGLAYYDDFDEWLNRVRMLEEGDPDNGVKTSTFFSKRLPDGKLIGCIKIHHTLTEELESGGHIAYGICPSERGKGYGRQQLLLGLDFAWHLPLKEVIIACDKENAASANTAVGCGGV
ncbi:MAG: GNAT family N-acetyltransferase, partial [Lachnospiraceae bacterium]|nr:GNAT family N-acetyltransferase [Lachnospiraceae bacterium]